MISPYPYQVRAVDLVRQAFNEGLKRVVVQAPTGAGKSLILLMIAAACVKNGKRVLFAVHLSEIMQDFATRAKELGEFDVGIIAPGHNRQPYAELQIISIQGAVRKTPDQLPPADVILYDELQHLPASTFRKILDFYPDAFIVGTTATPCRSDDKPLTMFERLIVAAKYSELLREKKIVPAMVFQPAEAHTGALALDPVEAYLKYGRGERGFCFVRGIETANDVAERMRLAGIAAEAVHSKRTKRHRMQAIELLRSGDMRILVSDRILTEGVNVPEASVCMLATPCHFVGAYMQMAGRVLRTAPGKTRAIVIDLVGSSLRHGLPHIDREFTLEGESFDKTALPPLKVCECCGYTQLAGRATCEGCGFKFLKVERKQPRIYSEELRAVYDFENTSEAHKLEEFLRLITESEQRGYSIDWVVRAYQELFFARPPVEWLAELPEARKRAEFERWAAFGRERGFKRGYAWVRYNETFGCAPSRSWAA